jgi:hypothetical protein
MDKQPVIHSKYNAKERFSFDEAPGEFKSVTEKSINDIKSYCTLLIGNKYKGSYDARSLYAMVGTVIGNFDLLYSRLRQDYDSRKSKLKKAQRLGIKKANEELIKFGQTVTDHEAALRRYNENVKEYDDQGIDDDLHFQKSRLEEFRNRLKKIEEKNHEA